MIEKVQYAIRGVPVLIVSESLKTKGFILKKTSHLRSDDVHENNLLSLIRISRRNLAT